MFSMLRNRLGIPGIVSVIALVFAMLGGAYAANNGGDDQVTASAQKAKRGKRGPRGPRGPKGAAGPGGPVGPQGAQGAQGAPGLQGPAGAAGAKGANGTNGTNGTSVTRVPATAEECPDGGVKYTSASGDDTVCNGEDGEDGEDATFGEPLASEVTLKGTWGGYNEGDLVPILGVSGVAPISFPIPLPADIEEANVHVIPFTVPETTPPDGCDDGLGTASGVSNPEADPGHLCLYQRYPPGNPPRIEVFKVTKATGGPPGPYGASTTGAVALFVDSSDDLVWGTWAVTAP